MLPSTNRLPGKFFVQINSRGRKIWGDYLLLKFIPSPTASILQFGIVVSTKVSKKAVIRNRIKRLISENIRLLLPSINFRIQAVIVAKTEIIDKDYHQIGRDIKKIFNKITRR